MKPKILFVFDHPNPKWWMDGLFAALNVLEDDFEIEKLNLEYGNNVHQFNDKHDFYLGWGAFNSPVDRFLQGKSSLKKGLCIAGNAFPPEGANNYDVLFYETKWYRSQIDFHPNIVHAFGVNTDLFGPIDIPTPIVWDYLGVGALANWKRWQKMIDLPGRKLVIGQYQENNEEESLTIARNLIKSGIMVSNEMNPFDLDNIYHWSRTLYQPANLVGGGERSVWEAKSCGLAVVVEDDNPKLKELVQTEVKDHHHYAKQLKKGIMSVL